VSRELARPEESSMKKLSLAVAITALLAACGQSESESDAAADLSVAGESASTEFANDDERIIYALGVVLAQNIAELDLTEAEFAIAAEGMRDVVRGMEPRVEMEVFGPQIESFANQRINASAALDAAPEREASAAFAAEIAAEPGAQRLPSGVVISPIVEGDGENPAATSTVTVHYHGTLRDGTVFDSSVDRGEPATFPLTGVISCWTEGVQEIKVGGKAKLLCPSDTAYGDSGVPGIPGGAALLFEVELLAIE
jgi:FKBP-type peptidyl-prolyl cis-trans isomerase